jgi:DNA recombination-dependent growth factor C
MHHVRGRPRRAARRPAFRALRIVNQQYMIALGANEKLLPGSIVRQIAARWL